MENDDFERNYWFCVQDCARTLVDTGASLDTFMNDVFDSVVKLNATDPVVLDLLAVLEQFNQLMEVKRANEAASEVFTSCSV